MYKNAQLYAVCVNELVREGKANQTIYVRKQNELERIVDRGSLVSVELQHRLEKAYRAGRAYFKMGP